MPAVRMCLPHSLDEVDHGDGIGRNTMVRPGQVVEQGDLKGSGIWLFTLKQVEQTCQEFVLKLYMQSQGSTPVNIKGGGGGGGGGGACMFLSSNCLSVSHSDQRNKEEKFIHSVHGDPPPYMHNKISC